MDDERYYEIKEKYDSSGFNSFDPVWCHNGEPFEEEIFYDCFAHVDGERCGNYIVGRFFGVKVFEQEVSELLEKWSDVGNTLPEYQEDGELYGEEYAYLMQDEYAVRMIREWVDANQEEAARIRTMNTI